MNMNAPFTSLPLLGFSVTVGILIIAFIYDTRRRRACSPPGPFAVPILGNLHRIPLRHPWIALTQMKNKYGGLIYFHGLGNSILVLNDLDVMLDLLVKKGNTHCSRPNLVVACELMDLVNSTAFAPFGNRWRLHRKFCRAALNTEVTRSYDNVLMDIAAHLNTSLRDSPADFTNHVRLMAGQVIMSIMYGISVQSADDPYIVRAEAAMTMISKAVIPGEFIVDLMPFLKHIPSWFPFARFHKIGREGREMIAELVREPFRYVQEEMNAGTASPSFTQDVLTKPELEVERDTDPTFEHAIQWAAASMYAAGQEVISSSVLNMIMGLALNPHKLKKAQIELDRVVGRERHPTIQDRQSLPYVHAIVKETLRWHPPLPMDIARSSIQDDLYKGYFIPKNTTLIPNIWVIAHAPDSEFPPQMFLPERFLPGRANPPPDPSSYCFGFGRRICPGRALAENTLFLMTASIINAFDIVPAVDQCGRQIPIRVDYSSGLVSLPESFQCDIKPRSNTDYCL